MKVIVALPDGNTRELQVREGSSLMEAIRDADLDIMAICGGSCSCGTCHVHIDPSYVDLLPPRSEEETMLVCNSPYFDDSLSRLGCQVQCGPELDGLTVALQKDAWVN